MAALGQVASKVASTVLRLDTNDDILRALALDSSQIEVCQRSFQRQWNKHNFHVKTFQEAKALGGVNWGSLNEKVRAMSA